MTAATMIMLALKASLELIVFCVGLNARAGDAMYLLRRPALLVKSILAMNVVMPVVALWFTAVFSLPYPIELALVALAMSPVPPFLPGKAMKSGGDGAYVVSLFTAASVIAIGAVPFTVWAVGKYTGMPLGIAPSAIAKIVGAGILAPLAAGIAVGMLAPRVAARIARPANVLGLLLLIASVVPLVFSAWPAFTTLAGNGTLLTIAAMTIIGLITGHALGGPNRDDRPVLALATATRHPAVALVVVTAVDPSAKLAPPAILLALIVGAIVSAPYARHESKVNDRAHRKAEGHPPHKERRHAA